MKNILIVGATGTFGKELTQKLILNGGCQLYLLARHGTEVYKNNDEITAFSKDATDIQELRSAFTNNIDVVYCAVSGEKLPIVAKNLVVLMNEFNIKRLIFMGAVGIYNEIPEELDGEDNLDNNSEQIPNRKAVDIIEESNLSYTILRPGYLEEGKAEDYIITNKGEKAKGYITTIPSVVNLAVQLIFNEELYSRKNISITKNMV